MNGPWFRLYTDWYRNVKVRALEPELQLLFIDLMCLHKEGHLLGATTQEIAWHLRRDVAAVKEGLRLLRGAKMILADGTPKGWNERQYDSDSSAGRVRKHRLKQACNVTCNAPETLLKRSRAETETDTESEQSPPNPQGGLEGGGGNPPATEAENNTGPVTWLTMVTEGLKETGRFPNTSTETVALAVHQAGLAGLTAEQVEAVLVAARAVPAGTIQAPLAWIRAQLRTPRPESGSGFGFGENEKPRAVAFGPPAGEM